MLWEPWKFRIFLFPPGRLTLHPMQVKGWIWNWFHNALGKFLRKTPWDVPRERKIVFFPFIYHQLQVCGWGICMSLGWVMNSFQPAGTPTTRLISAVCMFAHVIWVVVFSTCCWGTGMERCVRKGGIVLKPVGRTRTRQHRLTVWSLVTFRAGPRRLATQRCLMENSLLRWLNQG